MSIHFVAIGKEEEEKAVQINSKKRGKSYVSSPFICQRYKNLPLIDTIQNKSCHYKDDRIRSSVLLSRLLA